MKRSKTKNDPKMARKRERHIFAFSVNCQSELVLVLLNFTRNLDKWSNLKISLIINRIEFLSEYGQNTYTLFLIFWKKHLTFNITGSLRTLPVTNVSNQWRKVLKTKIMLFRSRYFDHESLIFNSSEHIW